MSSGVGELIYENGDKFRGNWLNDRANGEGILEYVNGDVYEGVRPLNNITLQMSHRSNICRSGRMIKGMVSKESTKCFLTPFMHITKPYGIFHWNVSLIFTYDRPWKVHFSQ